MPLASPQLTWAVTKQVSPNTRMILQVARRDDDGKKQATKREDLRPETIVSQEEIGIRFNRYMIAFLT